MGKFSYSRINTYNQCPQKYKIQYIDKIYSSKNSILRIVIPPSECVNLVYQFSNKFKYYIDWGGALIWMEVCELYENCMENMIGNGHFDEEFEHEEEPESEEELADETEQYLEFLQFQEDQQQDGEPDQHAIEDYQNHLEEITRIMLEQNQVRGE